METFLLGFGETINSNKAEQERMLLFYVANQNGEIISDQIIEIKDRIYLSTSSNSNANPLIASFPFLPVSRILDFTRDEIIFYKTDNFLIKKYNAEGEYLSAFYYRYPRRELNRDVVKQIFPSDYHQQIIDNNELPDFWPILSSVYVDDENRFWVSKYSNPNKNDVKYLVLDSSGKFIGQFELSKKYTLKNIREDNLYVINKSNPFVLKEYSINF